MKDIKVQKENKKSVFSLIIPRWLFVVIFIFWLPVLNIIVNLSDRIPYVAWVPSILWFFLVDPHRSLFEFYLGTAYEFPRVYPFTEGGGLGFTTLPWTMLTYLILALIILYFKKGKVTVGSAILYFLLIQFIIFSIAEIAGLSPDTVAP